MPPLFRTHSSISCFYCQSPIVPLPRNPRSFQCPHCDCWNRFDANGEISSDEPAMHDVDLNVRSFAKRGSPRKDRFPSSYAPSLFCHTCVTNQMLLSNLLSNYLPLPDDPEYERRLETLAEYRQSVELRYPPVCENCLPAVQEEIHRRDHMARTLALGGFLKDSKGKEKQRQTFGIQKEKKRLDRGLVVWRVRGFLWVATVLLAVASNLAATSGYPLPRIPDSLRPGIPALALVSVLWTAWDPTYASLKRNQLQGRAMRLKGKREYNVLQILAWFSRFLTASALEISQLKPSWDYLHLWEDPQSFSCRIYSLVSLVIELVVLIRCIVVLRVQRPPSVRLMDTTGHKKLLSAASTPSTRSATPAAEPDLLASLTLSNKPVLPPPNLTSRNPIFGLPSLPTAPEHVPPPHPPTTNRHDDDDDDDDERDPDAMDWAPTELSPPPKRANNDDASWLRPQRFFAPEEPTGLETLFARTIKLADMDEQAPAGTQRANVGRGGKYLRRGSVYLLCMLSLAGLAYKAWDTSRKRAEYTS